MKNIFKFTFVICAIGSIYLYGDQMLSFMLLTQDMTHQALLLFEYGVIIGYVVFVVFIVLLQLRNYHHLMVYKPVFGKLLLSSYQMVAVGFSIGVFVHFSFQKSILLALSFLLATAIFDSIRDKILSIQQGNIIHPKKIL